MEVKIDKSFNKDIQRLNNKGLNLKIARVIEGIQKVDEIHQIKDIKKLKGTTNYYRIRLDEYRIGLIIQKNTVEFIRCCTGKISTDTFQNEFLHQVLHHQ